MKRWAFVLPLEPTPLEGLAEALLALSSFVALTERGVWLEVGGSVGLCGGEPGLADQARKLGRRLSLDVTVTIADRPETAQILACAALQLADQLQAAHTTLTSRSCIVEAGHDADALALLPLQQLGASPRALAYLGRLGVRTAGVLRRLPPTALRKRLGSEGEQLVRLARAATAAPPERFIPPERPAATREVEPPVPPGEAILFLVKNVLDELTARLAGRGLAIAALRLTLSFEGGHETTEELLLPRPVRTTPPLLAVLQERLFNNSARALPRPDDGDWDLRVTEVEAQVLRTAAAPRAQLGLQSREEVDAEEMTTLLTRLTNTLGQENVFAAELVPTHRPEAAWQRASFARPRPAESDSKKKRQLQAQEQEVVEPPSPRPVFLLPEPLQLNGELLAGAAIRWEGGGGVVRQVWGPERLRGEWWRVPFERDYHVVDLRDGSRIWVYRDMGSTGLYLQGIFD